MNSILIFWLFSVLLFEFCRSPLVKSDFFLKYPVQPINSPNFTIAASFQLESENKRARLLDTASAMTMICEIERYNRKKGKYPVNGLFNLMIWSLNSQRSYELWSIKQQKIAQNLYFDNDTSRTLGPVQNTPIGGLIQSSSTEEVNIAAEMLSRTLIPSISINSENSVPYMQPRIKENFGSTIISQVSPTILADNIFKVFDHFNWNLVAAVASTDIVGFFGQNAVQDLSRLYRNVTFACYSILNPIGTNVYESDIDRISSCVLSSNVVRAIIVWMDPTSAVIATRDILKKIGSIDNLVFIYPRMPEELALKLPISSIFFEISLDSNFVKDSFSCSEQAREKIIETLDKDLIDSTTKENGNCFITDPSLPICLEDRPKNDETPCSCVSDLVVRTYLTY